MHLLVFLTPLLQKTYFCEHCHSETEEQPLAFRRVGNTYLCEYIQLCITVPHFYM